MECHLSRLSIFESLPGEIRNQIFEYCIADAINHCPPKNKWIERGVSTELNQQRLHSVTSRSFPSHTSAIKVSILPGWSGQPRIKTLGIGALPLLLVNRQIHSELSSLVDSRVAELSIGPYGIQYSNEDPNHRWELAYSLLKCRPYLLKYAKHVKVFLPWLRQDLLKRYWMSMGHRIEEKNPKCYGLMVIPKLAECLRTIESLSTLDIVLVAEINNPPKLDPLLELYDLCGAATAVDIVEPQSQGNTLHIAPPSLRRWVAAWEDCLFEQRQLKVLAGIQQNL